MKDELEKIKDSLMYDFPKHYTNSEIMAYQKGLEKLASYLTKEGYVKSVGSICSKHKEPNKDCELCKVHFPFAIDTEKYCQSAGYVKKAEIRLDEGKIVDTIIQCLKSLDIKEGNNFEWIHHPKNFLPANVTTDFYGVTKFREKLITALSQKSAEVIK